MRGSCDILVAEMWGIFHGLELAWNLGHRRVIVEADSLVVVNMMKQGCSASHPCSPLVQRAHTWINRDWHIWIQHSFREGNRVVDRLAAEGHKLPIGVHILVDPPDFIVDLLLEDSQDAYPFKVHCVRKPKVSFFSYTRRIFASIELHL
ncbi:putative reverse transcriptase [Senna tora]|uniref:Putative reverse transcriptase n=1 Tax=Senna tora TaxID=362788 RepID=A0A834TJV6_9FABA|nr:putative reverse transcriptase [Senna tora]